MSKPVRFVLALVAALVAWTVVATIINFGLRAAIPGYHAEELAVSFSLGSQIARLAMSLVATAAAGIAAVVVSQGAASSALVAGLLMLAMFIPIHIHVWSHFPVWYHLFFLTSLPTVCFATGTWWACRTKRP